MAEEPIQDDARLDALFRARRRGVIALAVTALVCVVTFFLSRGMVDLPGERECKTTSDCDGVIGVECLHAPTSTYCTHSCVRNEDCDEGFHCESPPWEKNMTEGNPSHATTRDLCLKNVAPPAN